MIYLAIKMRSTEEVAGEGGNLLITYIPQRPIEYFGKMRIYIPGDNYQSKAYFDIYTYAGSSNILKNRKIEKGSK